MLDIKSGGWYKNDTFLVDLTIGFILFSTKISPERRG